MTRLGGLWGLGCLLGPLALGCASTHDQSTYASCLREPRSYGDGETRTGTVTAYRNEKDYSPYQSVEGVFRTSITREHCKDRVHITGNGVDFQGGPWISVWDEAFAANYKKNRLAFAYYSEEHTAYVWVDGTSRGPYHDISISPRFSESGEHVAYLILESDKSFTLYADDRKIAHHPPISNWPFFYVLDDGRIAAPSYEKDKGYVVQVGDYRSPLFEELCSNGSFQVGPRGHYGFIGKLKGRWTTIIDGVAVKVSGMPSQCQIKFSEDGRRSGYLSMPVEKDPTSKQGVVLDGVLRPELELATEFTFQGSIPMATVEDKLSREGTVRVLHLVDLPTPAVLPSPDDTAPLPRTDQRTWVRVKIGDSVGPRLDVLEWPTLSVDSGGHVRYQGERGGAKVEVIDNVILGPRKPPSVAR